ncbi:substrate-binding domain-containing protein [Clostridium sp. PL3]|uniref:Substrate-binding domain-containing protein n=1 Tax=Clostridium thailandense TaxID=2794346 RepID=A0A949TSD4_9CLOT|nr:substrate-binding domain-containing protein [Clostridium thailandense]MBV7275657.1 substrate-binding domain-containing protein [Clostridium thailandense]
MIINIKQKKIIFATLFIILILTIVIIKFNAKNKSEEVQYVIGMSQANLTEPWRISMNEEIIKEAQKYKNVKIVYRDAGGDTEKQKRDIDELVQSGVDLLIVSMNDSKELTPVVSKAYKSIPVIVLDRAVEGYDYTLYIGPDNESIGRQAGNLVIDFAKNNNVKVIEIQGLLDSNPVVERSKGFRAAIKNYNNIEVSRTIIGEWQRDESEDKVKEILKEDNNIDIIFAHNDYMAFGAYKAVHELGIKNIKIIGVDGLEGENGGLSLVSQGVLEGTFTCPTGGKEAVDYALDILNKKEDIPKKIILRSDKITKSNVDTYLQNKQTKPASHKKIMLGYAQLKSESKWRDASAKSIKTAAKKAGMDLVFLESGTTQEDQKNLIRELIKKRVDIISFSPQVESGWDDVLKEAKNAGIPVIINDRTVDSDDSLWVCSIGSDFYEEGRRAGRLLADCFKDNKQANILEIKGTTGATPTIDREEGFKEIIKNYKNYKIVQSCTADFDYKAGKEAMKKVLDDNKNKINVVFAQNDDMAIGAVDAIKEKGLVPGKDIVVLGIDATKEALFSVKRGDIYGTVECNPLIGPQLVKTAEQVINGFEVPLRIINSENIFTEEFPYKEIIGRKY